MEKSKFFEEVKEELFNLRSNATKREIKNLNFSEFEFDDPSACIYGQMTGHCDSARAIELQPKKYLWIGDGDTDGKKCSYNQQTFAEGKEFTALEKYLFMCTQKQHRTIFQFLRGKIDDIEIV